MKEQKNAGAIFEKHWQGKVHMGDIDLHYYYYYYLLIIYDQCMRLAIMEWNGTDLMGMFRDFELTRAMLCGNEH